MLLFVRTFWRRKFLILKVEYFLRNIMTNFYIICLNEIYFTMVEGIKTDDRETSIFVIETFGRPVKNYKFPMNIGHVIKCTFPHTQKRAYVLRYIQHIFSYLILFFVCYFQMYSTRIGSSCSFCHVCLSLFVCMSYFILIALIKWWYLLCYSFATKNATFPNVKRTISVVLITSKN